MPRFMSMVVLLRDGPVTEQRDFVLGRRERETQLILCCARTVLEGAERVVDW